MNIILKSFDGPGDNVTMERTFRNMELGTCISINWELRNIPLLHAEEHLHYDAKSLKAGHYADVDWNTILPLDEQLIESMRDTQAVFMHMITRHSLDDIPYAERRRQYFDHLRYWNHILETKKIDLLLLNHVPHLCFDFVIYNLCRLKGIKTLYVERCHVVSLAILPEDWEDPGVLIRTHMENVKKEFADLGTQIPLCAKLEDYFQAQTVRDEAPWYMYPRHKHLLEKNFVKKWAGIAFRFGLKKPVTFLKLVISPSFWKRKIREHRIISIYDSHIRVPDMNKPFVYVPLHMQPEATTCPMGGAFVDQERMVQLLAWHLPKDVGIYVKEHPHQGEQMRSKAFYESMASIPNVTFVPRETSTVELTEKAIATATVTGTAGFESLFREKPVFLFGHVFYQDAVGVHTIHSSEDCRKAVESVCERKEQPTLRDIRIYLKAFEACSTVYEGAPLGAGETYTIEEQATLLGEALEKRIAEVLA